MKKFLSVLLAVMMVLSTVSFAAPSLVSVADTAVEAPVEEAVLAVDAAEENYIKAFEFNDASLDGVTGFTASDHSIANPDFDPEKEVSEENPETITVNGTSSFTFAEEGDVKFGRIKVTSDYGAHNLKTTLSGINSVAGELQDVKARVRFSNTGYGVDEKKSGFNFFVFAGQSGVIDDADHKFSFNYSMSGEWQEISFKTLNPTAFANIQQNAVSSLRWDFGFLLPKDATIDIDYIRFVGLPEEKLTLKGGSNTAFADTQIDVSAATTVSDVISMLVPDYSTGLCAVGLETTEGTDLALTDTVADYDELVVVWQKFDDFGFDFDTAFENGKVTVGGGTTGSWATLEPVDADEDETGKYAKFVYVAAKEDTETTRYGLPGDNARLEISSINIPAGELEKVVVRLRFTNIPKSGSYIQLETGSETEPSEFNPNGYHNYLCVWAGSKTFGLSHPMPSDGSWYDLVINKNDTTNQNATTSFRLDLPVAPQGLTIEVDDVIFVGKLVNEATLVMDPATAPAEKASYTVTAEYSETATADALLARVNYSDYYGTKYPYALLIDGELYRGNDVVGNLIANGDNVAVAWTELNIIAGTEFSSADDLMGDVYCDEVVEDGVLKLKRTAEGEIYLNFGDTLNVADVDDIQVRLRYVGNGLTDTTTSDVWFVAWDGNFVNNGITYPVNDGEWVTLSFKKNIGGSIADVKSASSKITAFRTPHFDADVMPTGTSIEIDFVRVIGFPAFDVEVDAGELGTLTGKYTKNTTVKQLVDSLEYPVSAKIVTGIVGAEDTDLVADLVAENGTLTAVLGDNVWFGEYGLKVFSIDFDDAVAGAFETDTTIGTLGAEINPAFGASADAEFQFLHPSGGDAPTGEIVEGVDGNCYKFTVAASGGNNVIMIDARRTGAFSNLDGHFVLSYDLKTPAVNKATTIQFNMSHQIEEGAHKVVYDLTENEWGTVVGYYPKNERFSNDAGTAHIDTIKDINIIKLAGQNTAAGDELYFDNITLWWLPKSVDVTVDVGTANAEADDATFTISTAETTAGDLAAKVYGGKKTVAGLALTEGGAALDADKPLTLTGDTTLYVTGWDDISYLEEWGAEFDTDTGYSHLGFNGVVETGWATWGWGNTYGEDDFISWNEDGYITMNYAASEAFKTAAGDVPVQIYDSNIYLGGELDGAPDGVGVPVGSVKQIQVRFRFRGNLPVSESTEVATYIDNAASTSTIDSAALPYFYYWNETRAADSPAKYILSDASLTTDEWQTVTIPASAVALDLYDLDVLRFCAPTYMPDGSYLDIDYIRFLGDTAEAPTTLSDATALRENKAGETYNNAIRFMATVNAVTKTRAADIGWLVSTEAYLDGAELTYDLYDENSKKVKVAYQKQNGADAIANYFNTEDDDANVFAAFLYNIPEKNALDNVVVRPFVKSGSKYLYGEEVVTNLYTMLNIDAYITYSEYEGIEDIIADGWYYEDAFADEFEGEPVTPYMAYNDAYTALDAEKQAYITAVLTALLG